MKPFLTLIPITATLAATAAEEPNIIYTLTDDLGINDFGCYGQKIIKTPRIDQMAKEGMQFYNHYSGSTVCAPTRSCLMTGQHTGRTRIRGNSKAHLKPEDVTVAEVLKKAGYATGCVGKWGLGEAGSPGIPNQQGFDFFFGYLNQSRAHRFYPDYKKDEPFFLYMAYTLSHVDLDDLSSDPGKKTNIASQRPELQAVFNRLANEAATDSPSSTGSLAAG